MYFKHFCINIINRPAHLFFCRAQANNCFLRFSLRICSWLIYYIRLGFSYIRNVSLNFKCSLMFFYPRSQVHPKQILLPVSRIHNWRLAIKTIIESQDFDPSIASMIIRRFSLQLQPILYAKNKFIFLPRLSKSIFLGINSISHTHYLISQRCFQLSCIFS